MGGAGKGKGGKGGKGSSGNGKGGGKASGVPAPPPSALDLPIGTELTAQFTDGEWYKASVVQVRKKAPEVKVHFGGYDASTDMWLGLDQLRSKLLQRRAGARGGGSAVDDGWGAPQAATAEWWLPDVGARCQVDVDGWGKYHAASVLAVSNNQARADAPIKVAVEMWVTPEQLHAVQKVVPAPKAAPAPAPAPAAPPAAAAKSIPVGTALTAQAEDGKWYKATVVNLRKGNDKPVRVHFDGWADSEDRWVGLDAIRSKLLKAATAEGDKAGDGSGKPRAKGKGKGKGKGVMMNGE